MEEPIRVVNSAKSSPITVVAGVPRRRAGVVIPKTAGHTRCARVRRRACGEMGVTASREGQPGPEGQGRRRRVHEEKRYADADPGVSTDLSQQDRRCLYRDCPPSLMPVGR